MRVLRLIRRICKLNRGNRVVVRQTASVATFRRSSGTMRRMSKLDPTLAQISAQFTGYDVERSGGGYIILNHFRSYRAAASDSRHRSHRTSLLVKCERPLDVQQLIF